MNAWPSASATGAHVIRPACTFSPAARCRLASGGSDYTVRVPARGVADHERIHRETLARLPGVASMQSDFTLATVKPWRGVPVAEG